MYPCALPFFSLYQCSTIPPRYLKNIFPFFIYLSMAACSSRLSKSSVSVAIFLNEALVDGGVREPVVDGARAFRGGR